MGRKRKPPADYTKEYLHIKVSSSHDLVFCKTFRVEASTANEKRAICIAVHHSSKRHMQLKKTPTRDR
ncbi:hypothetical protein HPB48_016579 [Haemaphysalis longicornis]|uniref:Uncharacterized protein n=1 Tax=Haemaphysalis longicornis TaxID=44386 RepID=A0A9J6GJS2_HAELO|nr:hypothetical protein HPB48_016579 [Haemaphysalis longicornis]